MEERIAKLQALLADETKQQEIFSGTIEEVREKLLNHGLDFSVEELESLAKGFADCEAMNGELQETDLENVAGGGYNDDCYKWGKKIGKAMTAAIKWAIGLFA